MGTLGYVLGIAAFCDLINFSPELGAFLAGVTLATIPYKFEIEDKVEPIKNLGVILFFVTLGFKLDIDSSLLTYSWKILITAAIVLFGTPAVMLILGYLQKLKSRPVFYIGIMLNQISEFSLIMATLSLQAGVFEKSTFTIITFASIVSILISSMGHSFIDKLYELFKTRLMFIDKHSLLLEEKLGLEELKLENHIIFLEYNEISDMMADKLATDGVEVLILDFDPDKVEHIKKNESKFHKVRYVDPLDPDMWKEFKFEKAKAIISAIEGNNEKELAIIDYLKNNNSKTITIIHSSNYREAIEMYDNGASFVILPVNLAGEGMINYLEVFKNDFSLFSNIRGDSIVKLKKAQAEYLV